MDCLSLPQNGFPVVAPGPLLTPAPYFLQLTPWYPSFKAQSKPHHLTLGAPSLSSWPWSPLPWQPEGGDTGDRGHQGRAQTQGAAQACQHLSSVGSQACSPYLGASQHPAVVRVWAGSHACWRPRSCRRHLQRKALFRTPVPFGKGRMQRAVWAGSSGLGSSFQNQPF